MSETGTMATAQDKAKIAAYQKMVTKFGPPPAAILGRSARAFCVGGGICVGAQGIGWLAQTAWDLSVSEADDVMLLSLIALACLLTGLGQYDRIAQWSGAGTLVPVTGFANAVASSALEHRSEGWVLGVAGNMFRLAGGLLVAGVISAAAVSVIRWSVESLWPL